MDLVILENTSGKEVTVLPPKQLMSCLQLELLVVWAMKYGEYSQEFIGKAPLPVEDGLIELVSARINSPSANEFVRGLVATLLEDYPTLIEKKEGLVKHLLKDDIDAIIQNIRIHHKTTGYFYPYTHWLMAEVVSGRVEVVGCDLVFVKSPVTESV